MSNRDFFRERALAELERIAALGPQERLKDFIVIQTYSHDMPGLPNPDSPYGYDDIPDSEYPAVVDREIDAFRRHVLHEAAEKIRDHKCGDTSPDGECCPCGLAAADLIDPDKEESADGAQ